MRDIQYKTIASGPAGAFQPGDVRHGVADDEAAALVNGGFASYVDAGIVVTPAAPQREQAIIAPAEHAVAPAQPRTAPRRSR